MIALIDYGAGNLTSVKKALNAIDAAVYVPDRPEALADAGGVIVPGVGHFDATRALTAEWVSAVRELVANGVPLLGICLGMQWLFEGSDEAPDCRGLGLIAGTCRRLAGVTPEGVRLKVPHVGWNALDRRADAPVIHGVPQGAQVYFTHSFVAPITDETAAAAEHGEPFAAIVQRGQVSGVQFHPEKSGDVGLRILRNFVRSTG